MSAALEEAVRTAVAALDPQQLADLAAGRGTLVYRPVVERAHQARRRPVRPAGAPAEVGEIVARVNALSAPGDVTAYLDSLDLTVPQLRQVARALGPTVASTGRTKAALHRDIVAGTVGFRVRSAAMSDGAWG